MNEPVYYLIGFCVAVILLIYFNSRQPKPLQPVQRLGRVSYVIDGDTLILDGVKPRIRLWGVDAPENGQGGASAATTTLQKFALNKRISFIEIDRDKYGRIVARVFLHNGKEINRLMIESKTTKEYCRYSKGFYGRC